MITIIFSAVLAAIIVNAYQWFTVRKTLIFLNLKLYNIMAKIQELEAKVDELTQAIADEHAQVTEALANLQTTVDELTAALAEAGTPEDVQRLIDKVNADLAAVKQIIPDDTEEPEEPIA